MKPHIHAESSAKKFGGKPDDYLAIHTFLDESKGAIADHRHRAMTHNTWFIMTVLPRVFGDTIKNSKGKKVSVREIGEQHVLEDFRGKFIPSAQDFLQAMEYQPWMNNGEAYPPSHPQGLQAKKSVDELAEMRKELKRKPFVPPVDYLPRPQIDDYPHPPTKWPPEIIPWPNSGTID